MQHRFLLNQTQPAQDRWNSLQAFNSEKFCLFLGFLGVGLRLNLAQRYNLQKAWVTLLSRWFHKFRLLDGSMYSVVAASHSQRFRLGIQSDVWDRELPCTWVFWCSRELLSILRFFSSNARWWKWRWQRPFVRYHYSSFLGNTKIDASSVLNLYCNRRALIAGTTIVRTILLIAWSGFI